MHIKVRYFAAFREAAGTESESIESHAATPAELFEERGQQHEALQKYTSSLVAINDEMSDWTTPLNDGDEVLFFPPVAGG